MAIFKSKKNTEGKEKVSKKLAVVETAPKILDAKSYAHVLLQPRVTEKASAMAEKNVYAFEVSYEASSHDAKLAVFEMYKVHPVKVAVLPIRRKKKFVRGKWGMKGGGRKAYVYLQPGDKIEVA